MTKRKQAAAAEEPQAVEERDATVPGEDEANVLRLDEDPVAPVQEEQQSAETPLDVPIEGESRPADNDDPGDTSAPLTAQEEAERRDPEQAVVIGQVAQTVQEQPEPLTEAQPPSTTDDQPA